MRRLALALLLVGTVALPFTARAEEEPPEPPADGSPVSNAEAEELVKALKKVARKKAATPILEVLDRMGRRSHEDFHKPLLKLLTHDSPAVAVRAADILAWQEVEDEKDRLKLAKQVWKEGFDDRDNERRLDVRGRSLRAVARIEGGAPLDEDRFDEVERLWRWAVENPDKAWGPGLVEICLYLEETKDKRMCRWLALEIDHPEPEDVNDPNNPPREWWKRRYELWREIKAAAVEALEELTGETFKTTADAKAWFEENGETFGFSW